MEIKKRANEHGVPVYDIIGLTEGEMLAIRNALGCLTIGRGNAVQYDVWLAISRALERRE